LSVFFHVYSDIDALDKLYSNKIFASLVLIVKDYNDFVSLFVFVVYRPCILILDSLKAGSVQKTVQVLRE